MKIPCLTQTLFCLFQKVLTVKYTQGLNAVSYSYERSGGTLWLFFEKSNGKEDWKNNFDFPAKPYRKMEDRWFVHRGFLKVFKSVEPVLEKLICDPSLSRVVIAGYSHGAALALLCHEYCVFHRPDLKENIVGIGFGCPRVVWGFLGKKVKKRFENFYPIRNHTDLITHLPPCLFGFRHAGNLLKIGKKAKTGPIASHTQEAYLHELSRLGS